MKSYKYFTSLLLMLFFAGALLAQNKTEKISVSGNCGMCKKKIETAAKDAGAVKADWSTTTKILTVTYNPKQTTTDKIEEKIAGVGYDTPKFRATDEAYNALDACCHYARKGQVAKEESHEGMKCDMKHGMTDSAMTHHAAGMQMNCKGDMAHADSMKCDKMKGNAAMHDGDKCKEMAHTGGMDCCKKGGAAMAKCGEACKDKCTGKCEKKEGKCSDMANCAGMDCCKKAGAAASKMNCMEKNGATIAGCDQSCKDKCGDKCEKKDGKCKDMADCKAKGCSKKQS